MPVKSTSTFVQQDTSKLIQILLVRLCTTIASVLSHVEERRKSDNLLRLLPSKGLIIEDKALNGDMQ